MPGLIEHVSRTSRFQATPLPAEPADRPRLLTSQDEAARATIDAISGARTSVDAAFFGLSAAGHGAAVGAALVAAARRGVHVSITMDALGNTIVHPFLRDYVPIGAPERRQLDALIAAGAEVKLSYPVRDARTITGVDHRKAIVVDDRIAIAGGMNFISISEGWDDAMVRMTGPSAAHLGALLRARAERIGRDRSAPRPDRGRPEARSVPVAPRPGTPAPRDGMAVFENDPRWSITDASEHLLGRLRSAKERVWVSSPFASNRTIAATLTDLARRGVDVRIVTSGSGLVLDDIGLDVQRSVTSETLKYALQAGARWIETDRPLHAKIALIDDETVVSSMNLTRQSHTRDVELLMATRDPAFSAQVEQFVESISSGGRRMPPTFDPATLIGDAVRLLVRLGVEY